MPVVFSDRREAGRHLAERLLGFRERECIVLGIPRGGVPVGYEISSALECPLDVVVPRKLPVPWSPEAGFGAVMPDGTRVLNRPMVAQLGLSASDIDGIAAEVLREVRRRERAYRGDRPAPELAGRVAMLVDDGLATGYTMLAAIEAARKQGAEEVVAAVPVSPRDSAERVGRAADSSIVLHVSRMLPFAVASFYRSFPDLSDEAVRRLLEERWEWEAGRAGRA